MARRGQHLSRWLNNYAHDLLRHRGGHPTFFRSGHAHWGWRYNLDRGQLPGRSGTTRDEHTAQHQQRAAGSMRWFVWAARRKNLPPQCVAQHRQRIRWAGITQATLRTLAYTPASTTTRQPIRQVADADKPGECHWHRSSLESRRLHLQQHRIRQLGKRALPIPRSTMSTGPLRRLQPRLRPRRIGDVRLAVDDSGASPHPTSIPSSSITRTTTSRWARRPAPSARRAR